MHFKTGYITTGVGILENKTPFTDLGTCDPYNAGSSSPQNVAYNYRTFFDNAKSARCTPSEC